MKKTYFQFLVEVICTIFHNGDENSSKSSIFSMLILSREEVICAIFFSEFGRNKGCKSESVTPLFRIFAYHARPPTKENAALHVYRYIISRESF